MISVYKNKSEYFGFPIVTDGETIIGTEQKKITEIIENQLIASTNGIKCSVFVDGSYSLIDNSDGTYSVLLRSNVVDPAIMGLLNGGLVHTTEDILWENLQIGKVHYLYLQYSDGMFQNPSGFRVVATTTAKASSDELNLYLAQIDLTGDPNMDTYPDGKIYSADMALHMTDHLNPHGLQLLQDYLLIKKRLDIVLEDAGELGSAVYIDDKRGIGKPAIETTDEMRLKDKRCTVVMSDDNNTELTTTNKSIIGAVNELNTIRQVNHSVVSGGETGTDITIAGASEIVNVIVTQEVVNQSSSSTLSSSSSSTAVEYIGNYSVKFVDNVCTIYNDGALLLQMRVTVFYKV